MSGTGGYLKDKRILILIAIVVALLALDIRYGVHFGIEFVGGTQIPITLEHTINVTAMSSLISALQQRVSTFGLKQVTVEGVGGTHVYVTIPSVSGSDVNQTIHVLQSQGRFDGVVNGKEAVNGSDIIRGSIGSSAPQQFNSTVQWSVMFYVTQSSAKHFAEVVLGQANQPLYMFLDRPSDAIVVVSEKDFLFNIRKQSLPVSKARALELADSALSLEGDNISVYVEEDLRPALSAIDLDDLAFQSLERPLEDDYPVVLIEGHLRCIGVFPEGYEAP